MGEAFDDPRIADRDEFLLWEALQVGGDAEAPDGDYRSDGPNQIETKQRLGVAMFVFKNWQNVIANIEEDDRQCPVGDASNARLNDLVFVGQQQDERHNEVPEKDDNYAYILPLVWRTIRVDFANVIPERFFRNVRIPDQEILRECDVGPEDGEGQH